jgi:hypothetical protein
MLGVNLMKLTNDGYVSENDKYWFRSCKEYGTYMRSKESWKIVKTHLTDHEFKHLCYGIYS